MPWRAGERWRRRRRRGRARLPRARPTRAFHPPGLACPGRPPTPAPPRPCPLAAPRHQGRGRALLGGAATASRRVPGSAVREWVGSRRLPVQKFVGDGGAGAAVGRGFFQASFAARVRACHHRPGKWGPQHESSSPAIHFVSLSGATKLLLFNTAMEAGVWK